MSEKDINRWQDTVTPRTPGEWKMGSGGSWDMTDVQPVPDEMLAELARHYYSAGCPWNCRSMPLSDGDREYMFLLYFCMQGLIARMRKAEQAAAASQLVTVDEMFLRAEFERMHHGRDLSRHYLRGTYYSPHIAALWNQHVKTATMLANVLPQEKA